MRTKYIILSLLVATQSVVVCASQEQPKQMDEPAIAYANPLVGTDDYGNAYPGAQTLSGSIQISLDTGEYFYDCVSGYKWNQNSI